MTIFSNEVTWNEVTMEQSDWIPFLFSFTTLTNATCKVKAIAYKENMISHQVL